MGGGYEAKKAKILTPAGVQGLARRELDKLAQHLDVLHSPNATMGPGSAATAHELTQACRTARFVFLAFASVPARNGSNEAWEMQDCVTVGRVGSRIAWDSVVLRRIAWIRWDRGVGSFGFPWLLVLHCRLNLFTSRGAERLHSIPCLFVCVPYCFSGAGDSAVSGLPSLLLRGWGGSPDS